MYRSNNLLYQANRSYHVMVLNVSFSLFFQFRPLELSFRLADVSNFLFWCSNSKLSSLCGISLRSIETEDTFEKFAHTEQFSNSFLTHKTFRTISSHRGIFFYSQWMTPIKCIQLFPCNIGDHNLLKCQYFRVRSKALNRRPNSRRFFPFSPLESFYWHF